MKIADMNILYDAFRASMKGSAWKEEPQRFEIDFLSELSSLKKELEDGTYRTLPGSEFTLCERGKIRHIHGGRMRDRVVRHALCDNVLTPALDPYLIYNNTASRTGRGIKAARQIFERDLHNYWLEYRTNEGYIGFVDLSKFYDNIRHDYVLETILPKIDEDSGKLLSEIVDSFKVDVSYMTDPEYALCLETRFDSVKYYETVPEEAKTGEKWMRKSVDIGDQASQNIGTFFPTPIDNYATCVRGHRRYGRYMDDIYVIDHDRNYLQETLSGITKEAEKLGLFVNEKKTRICKLSDTFRYLQIKYFLSDTGKVVKRINPKSVTRERRRLKAYKRLLDKGDMEYSMIEQSFRSWMGDYHRIMSKKQRKNMNRLFETLFRRCSHGQTIKSGNSCKTGKEVPQDKKRARSTRESGKSTPHGQTDDRNRRSQE